MTLRIRFRLAPTVLLSHLDSLSEYSECHLEKTILSRTHGWLPRVGSLCSFFIKNKPPKGHIPSALISFEGHSTWRKRNLKLLLILLLGKAPILEKSKCLVFPLLLSDCRTTTDENHSIIPIRCHAISQCPPQLGSLSCSSIIYTALLAAI